MTRVARWSVVAGVAAATVGCTARTVDWRVPFACTRNDDCLEGLTCVSGECRGGDDAGDPTKVVRITPVRGPVGTVVTVTGVGLDFRRLTSVAMGQVRGLVLRQRADAATFMVMPGSRTGPLSAVVQGEMFESVTAFTVLPTGVPSVEGGGPLVGVDSVGAASQGVSVAVSAGGGTALIGGWTDNGNEGAAWAWERADAGWAPSGPKLVGTGAMANAAPWR